MGWDGSSFKFLVHGRSFFFVLLSVDYSTDLIFSIKFLAFFGTTGEKAHYRIPGQSHFSWKFLPHRRESGPTRHFGQFQRNCGFLQKNRSRSNGHAGDILFGATNKKKKQAAADVVAGHCLERQEYFAGLQVWGWNNCVDHQDDEKLDPRTNLPQALPKDEEVPRIGN